VRRRRPPRGPLVRSPVFLRHVTDTTGRRRARGSSAYAVVMPRYDYRCRACGDTFEVSRPMSEASAPTACPQGHADTVKLLSTVAVTGRGGGAQPSVPAGGGCCGGACGC
jgi:putative FmdB family regulatory protein